MYLRIHHTIDVSDNTDEALRRPPTEEGGDFRIGGGEDESNIKLDLDLEICLEEGIVVEFYHLLAEKLAFDNKH